MIGNTVYIHGMLKAHWVHANTCMILAETFLKLFYFDSSCTTSSLNHCVSQKSDPLNILQQQPQICSDLNKILHTQDDICYKHYYIVSYKSALTVLKYEFLNNITPKSRVSIAVDVSWNSQNV